LSLRVRAPPRPSAADTDKSELRSAHAAFVRSAVLYGRRQIASFGAPVESG
jgi:hypothetical protein